MPNGTLRDCLCKVQCTMYNVQITIFLLKLHVSVHVFSVLSIRAGSLPKQPATAQPLAGPIFGQLLSSHLIVNFVRNLK